MGRKTTGWKLLTITLVEINKKHSVKMCIIMINMCIKKRFLEKMTECQERMTG